MYELAERIVERARSAGRTVGTAESCTGGLIAATLTDVPGASAVFTHGVVTYANEAKTGLLGVPNQLIASQGAVSAEVAAAMAQGMMDMSGTDVAVSVTGIAGPGGGSAEKPVGLVWLGLATAERVRTERHVFSGDRSHVRAQAVEAALKLLLDAI